MQTNILLAQLRPQQEGHRRLHLRSLQRVACGRDGGRLLQSARHLCLGITTLRLRVLLLQLLLRLRVGFFRAG